MHSVLKGQFPKITKLKRNKTTFHLVVSGLQCLPLTQMQKYSDTLLQKIPVQLSQTFKVLCKVSVHRKVSFIIDCFIVVLEVELILGAATVL